MTSNSLQWNVPNSSRLTNVTCVLIGVLLATLIRFPIQPVIHGASPFLFYIPVVVAMAVIFGFRSGLSATLLSILPANYYWMGVEGAFELDTAEFCQIVGFSFAGISVSWLSGSVMRRKRLEEHLRATLASIGEAIVSADCQGRIVYLNAAAQALVEVQGEDAAGSMISGVLNIVSEDGGHPLDGTFHLAVVNDEIEDLPKRIVLLSRSGRQYRVEQKSSRIFDSSGARLGTAIVFRILDSKIVAFPSAERSEIDVLNISSKLPRIAMVSTDSCTAAHTSWITAHSVGQSVYIRELSKKLGQSGYEVDIWAKSLAGIPQIEFISQRVRIIRVSWDGQSMAPSEKLAEMSPSWQENVLQKIKKYNFNYEFVYSHCCGGGHAGGSLSAKLRVPHIHTPHYFAATRHSQNGRISRGVAGTRARSSIVPFTAGEYSFLATADLIVASNARQEDILFRRYSVPRVKQRRVSYGYDEGRFFTVSDALRKSVRERLGFTGPVVQTAYEFTDVEKRELLVEAFAIVSQQMPEVIFSLLVSGNSLTADEVQDFIQLRTLLTQHGLSKKTVFKGIACHSQLADYYRAADVFVQTSPNELFSMTTVEAMACGASVVAGTRSMWHSDLKFGVDALYADLANPSRLADAILSLLRQPSLRQEISRNGTERARIAFSWTATAEKFMAAIER